MPRTKRVLPPLEYERYYKDTAWMALPLLCLPCYFYGLRPVALCLVALVVANLCDRVVAKLRARPYDSKDCSSESFAMLLVLLMPASVPWYVLVMSVLACVLIGKEAFGGYGSYPFHPTAVGYAIAAVSWPEHMFQYPQLFTKLPLVITSDISLSSGMTATLKNGGLPIISDFELFLGEYAGPIGATAALVLAACALFLWVRRDVNFPTIFSFLFVCAMILFLFPRQEGLDGAIMETVAERLNVVKFEMLSGSMLFGAVLLICEPYTCPKHWLSRFLYGALLGVVAMMFRYYGVYETGICFALLMVSTIASWLDRSVIAMFATWKANRALKKQAKGGSAT